MRAVFGQITFAVAVLIITITEVGITVVANVLAVHTCVLTFNHLPTFIAPEISVIIVAVGYLPGAFITVMLGGVLVCAVDDSVTTVAVVVLVLVYVIANELAVAFIAVAVVIIIAAPDGNPYFAVVAGVITVRILVAGVVGILFALGFLAADVANCVFILVDVIIAIKLVFTFVARPIAVGICANIRHPAAALITIVIAILVYVILAKLLHTVSRVVAILASSVIIPVKAIVAQPKIAIITEVIVVIVLVHKVVILITPVEILETSIAKSVSVFVHVLFARNQVLTYVTVAITVLVYAGDRIPANITPAVAIFICTHIVEASTADSTFM